MCIRDRVHIAHQHLQQQLDKNGDRHFKNIPRAERALVLKFHRQASFAAVRRAANRFYYTAVLWFDKGDHTNKKEKICANRRQKDAEERQLPAASPRLRSGSGDVRAGGTAAKPAGGSGAEARPAATFWEKGMPERQMGECLGFSESYPSLFSKGEKARRAKGGSPTQRRDLSLLFPGKR